MLLNLFKYYINFIKNQSNETQVKLSCSKVSNKIIFYSENNGVELKIDLSTHNIFIDRDPLDSHLKGNNLEFFCDPTNLNYFKNFHQILLIEVDKVTKTLYVFQKGSMKDLYQIFERIFKEKKYIRENPTNNHDESDSEISMWSYDFDFLRRQLEQIAKKIKIETFGDCSIRVTCEEFESVNNTRINETDLNDPKRVIYELWYMDNFLFSSIDKYEYELLDFLKGKESDLKNKINLPYVEKKIFLPPEHDAAETKMTLDYKIEFSPMIFSNSKFFDLWFNKLENYRKYFIRENDELDILDNDFVKTEFWVRVDENKIDIKFSLKFLNITNYAKRVFDFNLKIVGSVYFNGENHLFLKLTMTLNLYGPGAFGDDSHDEKLIDNYDHKEWVFKDWIICGCRENGILNEINLEDMDNWEKRPFHPVEDNRYFINKMNEKNIEGHKIILEAQKNPSGYFVVEYISINDDSMRTNNFFENLQEKTTEIPNYDTNYSKDVNFTISFEDLTKSMKNNFTYFQNLQIILSDSSRIKKHLKKYCENLFGKNKIGSFNSEISRNPFDLELIIKICFF